MRVPCCNCMPSGTVTRSTLASPSGSNSWTIATGMPFSRRPSLVRTQTCLLLVSGPLPHTFSQGEYISCGAEAPPQLMYSPWLKVCGKGPETNNKQVCVLTKDGRLENGMPVAIVQLFEPEGEAKVLRVTVPLGMQLQHGTRMMIDQDQPAQQPYKICFPVGCMSDYPVTDDMIAKMKKGQQITLQAINMQGTPISLPLPLADFAKAYDGPPTDPKVVEEQQRKLQEELQKRAEDARKKLEAQQPATAAPAPAPAPAPAQQK